MRRSATTRGDLPADTVAVVRAVANQTVPLLSAKQAACRLGISAATFYAWLGQSDYGLFIIRGQPVTIRYFQGGPNGQGRIRIEPAEVERINELMRVVPQHIVMRRPPVRHNQFPGITARLGRPSDAS